MARIAFHPGDGDVLGDLRRQDADVFDDDVGTAVIRFEAVGAVDALGVDRARGGSLPGLFWPPWATASDWARMTMFSTPVVIGVTAKTCDEPMSANSVSSPPAPPSTRSALCSELVGVEDVGGEGRQSPGVPVMLS
jgi:hypothetical protein